MHGRAAFPSIISENVSEINLPLTIIPPANRHFVDYSALFTRNFADFCAFCARGPPIAVPTDKNHLFTNIVA